MEIAALAAWLEQSALGQTMRGGWAYPLANVLHLAGLVLLLGPILLLDLRLLGYGKRFPAASVSRTLTPFAVAGLLLAVPSGLALFAADAQALLGHRLMQLKLLAIALALGNALLFRLLFERQLIGWDRAAPLGGRICALLSLLLWPAVMVAGRWIAYA